MRGLIYVNAHKYEMVEFSKGEFPTASEEDLRAALNRAFEDEIFSTDGFIPQQAWTTGEAVVRQANILKEPVGYDAVIDMRFVKELQEELGISEHLVSVLLRSAILLPSASWPLVARAPPVSCSSWHYEEPAFWSLVILFSEQIANSSFKKCYLKGTSVS